MAYSPNPTWADGPGGNTPITAAKLNTLEAGLVAAAAQADANTTAAAGKAPALVPTAVKTSAYTAAVGDFVPVDTTSGNVAVTLPSAPADKTQVGVKHIIQGGTNTVSIVCAGSDVINKTGGVTTLTLKTADQGVILQYKASGALWYVSTSDLALGQLDLRYTAIGTSSDLPEFSNAPQTAAVTASGMLSKLTRFDTTSAAISQMLPPAVPGGVLAFAWDVGQANALTIVGASRTDTAGTTSGSSTVTDTSIVAADLGRAVTGAGIPAGSFVGTPTAGASFLLSSSATSQVAALATATAASVSITVQDTFGVNPVVSYAVPLAGEVINYHCTTAGRWRAVSGLKPQTSLDARYLPAGISPIVAALVLGG